MGSGNEIPVTPVKGYQQQTQQKLDEVNINKEIEERLLRRLDDLFAMAAMPNIEPDMRWLNIAKTHFQEGFMAMNRALMKPQRISLPEDAPADEQKQKP